MRQRLQNLKEEQVNFKNQIRSATNRIEKYEQQIRAIETEKNEFLKEQERKKEKLAKENSEAKIAQLKADFDEKNTSYTLQLSEIQKQLESEQYIKNVTNATNNNFKLEYEIFRHKEKFLAGIERYQQYLPKKKVDRELSRKKRLSENSSLKLKIEKINDSKEHSFQNIWYSIFKPNDRYTARTC